ncbi:hypothetical protein [Vreelandella sp. EE22]
MWSRVVINKTGLAVLVLAVSSGQQAWAITENDVKNVMFDFATAATCSDAMSPDDFYTVQVVEPEDIEIMRSYGAQYAVAWYGDLYCSGGRTSTWQISYVGIGVADSPFVDLSLQPIHIDFVGVDSIDIDKNENLRVTGVAYGPDSQSHWDTVEKRATVSQRGELISSEMLIDGSWVNESETQ